MNILQNIHRLQKSEKLLLMEYLWKDLSEKSDEYESPDWHKDALLETEKRVASGKEEAIDWFAAKKQLRDLFNDY